jgi:hypothetical protein
MRNYPTKRQQLGRANPISKLEMQKLVQASTVPITKLPMMPEEETETDRMWALFKRTWHTPAVVEVPVKPTIVRRV